MKERILVINVNWVGDVIFSTPAVRAIRRHYPAAHIAGMVVKRCEDVLRLNPHVDELIVYDERGRDRGIANYWRFIAMLRRKQFQRVFILHPSLKRALLAFFAGIPERAGYATKRRAFLLTMPVPPPAHPLHKIDYFLQLLYACGIAPAGRECEFFFSSADEVAVNASLAQAGVRPMSRYVVLNPGGNWLLKRWPPEYFARLADMIIERLNLAVVIAGGPGDRALAEELTRRMRAKPVVMTGRFSLQELGALMKHSCGVVSADSGPMHIAVAVGAPTLALFGPTSVRLTGPVGKTAPVVLQSEVDCRVPCYMQDCPENRCMRLISPEEVFEKINHVFQQTGGHV
ncbi:MAG: lipopolysaccharide heptosyltransferase II [Candidatus Omnitrophica bacterium]|nr:lipopolysaccharide heptosyltransferase II [Candidatus Omnitrophota bacterium]